MKKLLTLDTAYKLAVILICLMLAFDYAFSGWTLYERTQLYTGKPSALFCIIERANGYPGWPPGQVLSCNRMIDPPAIPEFHHKDA